ncbi:MAG: HRDC domain-containing protein [Planctomycetota bacterium]
MRVKLFTFRYSATLGGFDEEPLQHFLRDKEVVAFREHFYAVNDVPHVTCIVTWQDAVVPAEALRAARQGTSPEPGPRRSKRGARPDPSAALNESDRVLFNTLREWRLQRARDQGVPPYVVLTNRELVEIVVGKPDCATARRTRGPRTATTGTRRTATTTSAFAPPRRRTCPIARDAPGPTPAGSARCARDAQAPLPRRLVRPNRTRRWGW